MSRPGFRLSLRCLARRPTGARSSPKGCHIVARRETPGSEFALPVLHPEGVQHHLACTADVAPLQGAGLIYRYFPGHSGRAMMLFPFGEREAGLDSVNPYQERNTAVRRRLSGLRPHEWM